MHNTYLKRKSLESFFSNVLKYKEDSNTELYFSSGTNHKGQTVFILNKIDYLNDENVSTLATFVFDDFSCRVKLNPYLIENQRLIVKNANKSIFDISKSYRKFATRNIQKNFGDVRADIYVEDFYASDYGNGTEYDNLKEIINKNAEKEI